MSDTGKEGNTLLWNMLSDDQKAEVLLLNAAAKLNKEQASRMEVK